MGTFVSKLRPKWPNQPLVGQTLEWVKAFDPFGDGALTGDIRNDIKNDKSPISNNFMGVYCEILQERFNQNDIGRVRIVHPNVLTTLEATADAHLSETIDTFVTDCRLFLDGILRYIYFPYNVNNAHWVVFRLSIQYTAERKADVSFQYYDSLSTPSTPVIDKAKECAVKFLTRFRLANGIQPFESPVSTTELKGLKQKDGHSCGYFVLAKIEYGDTFPDVWKVADYRKLVRGMVFERVRQLYPSFDLNEVPSPSLI